MSKSRTSLQLWLLPGVLLATVHAQDKRVEESAPIPSAAVQQVLDEAAVASNGGDAVKALGLADHALTIAQQAADTPGEAQAQRIRAVHLVKLDRKSEAQTAWRDAEAVWKRLGDGPGQVEALGWQAVLEIPAQAPQRTEFLQRDSPG